MIPSHGPNGETPARRASQSATAAKNARDGGATPGINKEEIERVAALRYALRLFTRKTEIEARKIGLTPQQYMLLLAIKGFPSRDTANITELAERLQIRHNAVIGLVNRAEERGYVKREPNAPGEDRRVVQVRVTPHGETLIQRMAQALHDERERVAAAATALTLAQDAS